MWKNKNISKWKNSSKKVLKRKIDRDKISITCYECKKLGYFKLKFPNLKKSNYKSKEKKGLMST